MTTEEIKRLPTEEKFLIMEALWDDLRDHFEHAEIPESHKELLRSRRQRVETGESKLLDWDEVKSSVGRP
jgi:putative addiction module component (TIGR02574 family)